VWGAWGRARAARRLHARRLGAARGTSGAPAVRAAARRAACSRASCAPARRPRACPGWAGRRAGRCARPRCCCARESRADELLGVRTCAHSSCAGRCRPARAQSAGRSAERCWHVWEGFRAAGRARSGTQQTSRRGWWGCSGRTSITMKRRGSSSTRSRRSCADRSDTSKAGPRRLTSSAVDE